MFHLFICLSLVILAVGDKAIVIQNDAVAFQFDPSYGHLTHLIDKSTNKNMASPDDSSLLPLWKLGVVDAVQEVFVDNIGHPVTVQEYFKGQEHFLALRWDLVPVPPSNIAETNALVNVSLGISLEQGNSPLSKWMIDVSVVDGRPIGLWEARISVPVSVGSSSNRGELFFPSGFGTAYSKPASYTGGSVRAIYPGDGAAMQFMALCDLPETGESSSGGVFISALDPSGYLKALEYSTYAYEKAATTTTTPITNTGKTNPGEALVEVEKSPLQQRRLSAVDQLVELSLLSITMYPDDSGMIMPHGTTWSPTYAIAVGVVTNIAPTKGRPLWYMSSLLYRQWAVVEANVDWITSSGTSSGRDNKLALLPDWYLQNNVWINTHWQCHDIFNETGGDPAFVLPYVTAFTSSLNLSSVILHWYEWQQGPNPDRTARYKFDTHYPDYFPARESGDGFAKAITKLRTESNVYTMPYINGRILDINSDSYLQDSGDDYCIKQTDTPTMYSNFEAKKHLSTQLHSKIETYGSNATFCVANPYTTFWQDKVSQAAGTLVSDYGAHGVYIDQVGASSMEPCWNPHHKHALGGGNWWKQGYDRMLAKTQDKTLTGKNILTRAAMTATRLHNYAVPAVSNIDTDKDLETVPIVTECNAETYMDRLSGYLTISTFKASLAQSPTDKLYENSWKRLAPAFPAVYGGHYIGFGAKWGQSDFNDHDWWCAKLASQLINGVQLGWFSLTGTDHDSEDSCGPMGVGDLLLDEDHRDLLHYLKVLAAYRTVAVQHLLYGHMVAPVSLHPVSEIRTQTSASKNKEPLLDYDTISTSSWMTSVDRSGGIGSGDNSVMVLLATATENSYQGKIRVDLGLWGCASSEGGNIMLVDAAGNRSEVLAIASDEGEGVVWVPVSVLPRDVLLLEFECFVR